MSVTEKLKVCLVGASGVGKTSLASRFARSSFSDRYRTTIGVAIERRDIRRGDRTTQLVIWDLSGEDEFQTVQPAYFRGAAGYLLVVDGSRPETIETALGLQERLRATVGNLPFVIAVNKLDLLDRRVGRPREFERLERDGWVTVYTSAKTGIMVEEAFGKLVDLIHTSRGRAWI